MKVFVHISKDFSHNFDLSLVYSNMLWYNQLLRPGVTNLRMHFIRSEKI